MIYAVDHEKDFATLYYTEYNIYIISNDINVHEHQP